MSAPTVEEAARAAGLQGPARDREVAHMIVDRGMSDADVGQRFAISSSRVKQIMARETRRIQVISFLAAHRDERVSAGEIAHAVKVDVAKVDYVVRGLVKTGRALASSSKVPTSNGVRDTWEGVRLTKRGINEFDKASRPKRTVGSSVRSIIDAHKEVKTTVPNTPDSAAVEVVSQFPNISKLLTRGDTLQEAASLIENAGEQYADLALTVLSKIDEFTSLEREVLEYVRTHPDKEKA